MKYLATIFLIATIVSSPLEALAQSSSESYYKEFSRGFAIGLRSERNAWAKIDALKLSFSKSKILLNHYLNLVEDDRVVSRLFDEVVATGVVDKVIRNPDSVKDHIPAVTSLGYELFESLAIKGLRRLDYPDIKFYLEVTQSMLQSLPKKICRSLIAGDVTNQKESEAFAVYLMQRMTDAELTVYLGLIRKATLAEVRDYPAVRQVSEAQRKLADESFEQIFFDEIKRHPRSNQLIAASTNLKLAADADACDLSLLTFKSILRMRGLVAEWQTRVFVESLQ